MFYNVFYGISSHSTHGNWQDILYNHLEKVENGFKLNMEWNRPRPQIIDGAIVFNLSIVEMFNDKEIKDISSSNTIKEKVKTLFDYDDHLRQAHEEWLTKKNGL